MPAAKKDPSTRSRSNRASTAADLDGGRVVPKSLRPKLPQRIDGDGNTIQWHSMTVEWWDDMWASPMAAEYHSSDRHGLFILAGLVEDYYRALSPTGRKEAATEIRLQRKDFGLTPYDRRRLEWTIETADEAKDRGERRRAGQTQTPSATTKKKVDPRSVLSVVS